MYWWNQGRRTMSGRRALTYRPAAGKQAQTHTCVGDADGFFHLLPLVWETSSNNVAKYCYQLPDGKLLAVLGVPKVVAVAAAEERGRLQLAVVGDVGVVQAALQLAVPVEVRLFAVPIPDAPFTY